MKGWGTHERVINEERDMVAVGNWERRSEFRDTRRGEHIKAGLAGYFSFLPEILYFSLKMKNVENEKIFRVIDSNVKYLEKEDENLYMNFI